MLDALLAATGLSREDLSRGAGELPALLRAEGIEPSPCIDRILQIPKRPELTLGHAEQISDALRFDPSASLRIEQATALRELHAMRGLFAPMRVGTGKTLVTLLAPTVLASRNPVLLIPASLREKTRLEFLEYRRRWNVRLPKIISYTEVAMPDREHLLLQENPDLLILDEAHKARDVGSATARRIGRCVQLLRPPVACLSGTLIGPRFLDYWHLMLWALKEHAPVPFSHDEAVRWGKALDAKVPRLQRLGLGALDQFPDGWHVFARTRRGVVPTEGAPCTAAIDFQSWCPSLPLALHDLIEEVRETKTRPDGMILEDMEVADCVSQIACGFWYTWDPLPPKWWLDPRSEWNMYLRHVLDQFLPEYDSPGPVASALYRWEASGRQSPAPPNAAWGLSALRAWKEVEKKFTPNKVPVWIDDTPLRHAAMSPPGTLIWTRHIAAGERLAELGVPYYGGGTNPQTARPGTTLALSISAHGTGRNLQNWGRMLVLTPMASAESWEQVIGRIHRHGQKRDKVEVLSYTASDYHLSVIDRVMEEAEKLTRDNGFESKLTIAQRHGHEQRQKQGQRTR